MASIDDELLRHQYFYIPWVETPAPAPEPFQIAAPLAAYLAQQRKARLTVVTIQKSTAPEALRKSTIVTQRSGTVMDGGVVLAFCPSYQLMDKITSLKKSVVVLAEWPTESHEGWAKLVGAYNLVTGSVMGGPLDEATSKSLKAIVFDGYKGWNDDIAVRMTLTHLRELHAAGGYDRGIVEAFARSERGEHGIAKLYGILDSFDTSLESR
jgi:hypothetical protein